MGTMDDVILPRFHAIKRWLLERSIVVKITLFVGLLLATLACTLIGVVFHYTSEMLRDQISNRLSVVADDRAAILQIGFDRLEDRVRAFANRYRILDFLDRNSGPPRRWISGPLTDKVLDDVRTDTPGLLGFWIEDHEGRVIAVSGPSELIDRFSDKHAPRIAAHRVPALVGFPQRVGETYAGLFKATARTTKQGELGSCYLVMDMKSIVTELADPRWLGRSGEVLVGLQQGESTRFLFPPRFEPGQVEFPMGRTDPMNRAIDGPAGFSRTTDRFGHEVLVAYRPLTTQGWGLVAKLDVDEADAPVNRLRRMLLAVGGTILALSLAASYLIARHNTRSLRRLVSAADAVARGDLNTSIDGYPGDEIGTLGLAFSRMTDQLARAQVEMEDRISTRTRELEATRDLLDAFFQIFTSQLDHHNIDRTFDTVLRFCHQLGYDLAMISLVDRERGVIQGVRGGGTMADVVGLTVRSLNSDDILAQVVRGGRAIVIGDSTIDPRCDQSAVNLARIHGQIILPLVGDEVFGTLQVATPEIIDPLRVDLRPLESLASHTARALVGLRQVEEIGRLNLNLETKAEELVKSEGALREQTRILRSVLDCMREGVVVADHEARLLVFNPAAERILGRNPRDSDGHWHPLHGVFHSDRVSPFTQDELPLYRAIHGETLDDIELFVAHAGLNHGLWMLVNARPLRDEQSAVQGGLVVFHDVTRRKHDEQRMAVQFATTRVLTEVDSLNEAATQVLAIIGESLEWDFGGFWRVDRATQTLRCVELWHTPGRQFPGLSGRSRETTYAPGVGLPGVVWSSRQADWIDDMTSRPDPRFHPDGEGSEGLRSGLAVPILVRGDCLGVLEVFSRESRPRDDQMLETLTNLGSQIGQFIERQQMHARVVQSERLASLGLLSAGIAHEINNPLAYIGNNLAVLERDTRSLMQLLAAYERSNDLLAAHRPECLAEIEALIEECDFSYIRENLDKLLASTRQGVSRMGEIVHNLRGFARLDRPATDQLDLRDAITSALEMIRGRLDRRHIVVEQRHDDIPLISVSPVQINQVFLNLLVNAMQAIESTHREDGRILIHSRCNGKEVEVVLSDNGCGIQSDVLPKIFDPFFTTKGVGDGTGLGLSITHGIIHDHGGRLEVESAPGQGTCFRITLPISRK